MRPAHRLRSVRSADNSVQPEKRKNMMWNEADIEMAEAVQASNHRATLLGGGMGAESMRAAVDCVKYWLDAGYFAGSFDALIQVLEDNADWRPTDSEFDEMQWAGWEAHVDGQVA